MAVQSLKGRLVTVKTTGEDGSNFPVHGDACYIGRALGCNIRIVNDELRDRHCVIKVSDLGKTTIYNLDFEKPVLLNDKEVSSDGCIVEVGDLIRILNYTFRWEKAEAQDDLVKHQTSLIVEKSVPAADVHSERYSAPPCLLDDESKENREKANEKSDVENGVEEEKFEDCFEEIPDLESQDDMLHPDPTDPSMDRTSLDEAQNPQSLLQSPKCFDKAYHSTPKCTPIKLIPKDRLNPLAVSCDLTEQSADLTQSPSKLRGRRSTGIVPCVGTPSDVYRTTRGILTPANKSRFDRTSMEVQVSLALRDSLDPVVKSAKRFRQRSSERKSTPLKPRVSDKSMARDSILHSPIIEDYSREKCEESQNESGGNGDSKYRFVASRRRRPFRGSSFAVENRIAEESETGQSDLTSDECSVDEEDSLIASSYCDKFIENSFDKSGDLPMSTRIVVNGDTRASDDELNSTFTIDVHDDEKEASPAKSSITPPKSILTPLPDPSTMREKSAKKVTFARNVIDEFGESSLEATTLTDSYQTSAPPSLASIDVSDVDLTNKARNSEESFCRNEALYMADETPSERSVSPPVAKACSTPVGYVHVEGVKRIFKTPCGAYANYDNVKGIKRLLKTPVSPACSYENVDGVADLLKTPKAAVIAGGVECVVNDATLIESTETAVESEPVEEALMDVTAADAEVRSQTQEASEEAASSPAKSDADVPSTEVESESPEKVDVAPSAAVENETQEVVEMASSVLAGSETLEEMSIALASDVDVIDSGTEEVAQDDASIETENVLVEASTAAKERSVVEAASVDPEREIVEAPAADATSSEEAAKVDTDSEPVEALTVADKTSVEVAMRIDTECEPVEMSVAADETSVEEATRIDTESEPVETSAAAADETSAEEATKIDIESEPVESSAIAHEMSTEEATRIDIESKPVETSAAADETSAERATRIDTESEPLETPAATDDETFVEEAVSHDSEDEPVKTSIAVNETPVEEAASVDPESETVEAEADGKSCEETSRVDTDSKPVETSAAVDETSAEEIMRIDTESEPVEMSAAADETSTVETTRIDTESEPIETSAAADETSVGELTRIGLESEPAETLTVAGGTSAEEATRIDTENEPAETSTAVDEMSAEDATKIDIEAEPVETSAVADETSAEEAVSLDSENKPVEVSAAADGNFSEEAARVDSDSESVEVSAAMNVTSEEAPTNALPEPVSETSLTMTNLTVDLVEIEPTEPPTVPEVVCAETAPKELSETVGEVAEKTSMDAASSTEAAEETSAGIASNSLVSPHVEPASQISEEPTENEVESDPMESLELPESAVAESASIIIESGPAEKPSTVVTAPVGSQTSVAAEPLEAETKSTELSTVLTDVVAEASIQPSDTVAIEASVPSDDVPSEITFPCDVASPLPNYENVDGMKRLFKTPCGNRADYRDVEGVQQLLKTPADPHRSLKSAGNPVLQILKVDLPDSNGKSSSVASKPIQRKFYTPKKCPLCDPHCVIRTSRQCVSEQKAKSAQNEELSWSQKKSIEKNLMNPILQITKVDVPEYVGAKSTSSGTVAQEDEEPPTVTRVSSKLKNIENVYPNRRSSRSKRVSGKLTKTLPPSPAKSTRTSINDLTSPCLIVIPALNTHLVNGVGDETKVSKNAKSDQTENGDAELAAKSKRAPKKSVTKCVTFPEEKSQQNADDQETVPVVRAMRSTRAIKLIAEKEATVPKKPTSKRVTFPKGNSSESSSEEETTTLDKVKSSSRVVKPVAEKNKTAPTTRRTRGRPAAPLKPDSVSRQPIARAIRRVREAPSSDEVQPPKATKKRAVRAGLADEPVEPTVSSPESPAKGKRAVRSSRKQRSETTDPQVASPVPKRKRATRGGRAASDEGGDAKTTRKRTAVMHDDANEQPKPVKTATKNKSKASDDDGDAKPTRKRTAVSHDDANEPPKPVKTATKNKTKASDENGDAKATRKRTASTHDDANELPKPVKSAKKNKSKASDDDEDTKTTRKRTAVTHDDAKEPPKPVKTATKDKTKVTSKVRVVEDEAPRSARVKRAKMNEPPADESRTEGARETRNRKQVTVLKKTLVKVTKTKTVVKRRLSTIAELMDDEPPTKKAKPVSVKSSRAKDGGKKTADKMSGDIRSTDGETEAASSRRPTRTVAKKSEKEVISSNKRTVGTRAAKKLTAKEEKSATRSEISPVGRVTRNKTEAVTSTTRLRTRRG